MTSNPGATSHIIGGRYELRRLLGQGGMAQVYAAYDSALGRTVALKRLKAELASLPQARERFLREARIAARLNHPCIARIYDVGDDQAGAFFVQELVEGESLDQKLPLTPPLAVAVTLQLAETLDFIHNQGVVHCDVKPQNIILTTERPVLLDFGIAEPPGAAVKEIMGTPHYLAPERAQGAPPTPAADVYAVGILLYELLTGKVPLDGSTSHEIIHRHITEGVPLLRQVSPGIAPALESLLARATNRDPAQRPSMAELATELRQLSDTATRSTVAVATVPHQATVSIHNMSTQVVAAPRGVHAAQSAPAINPAPNPPLQQTTVGLPAAQKSRSWKILLPALLAALLGCGVLLLLTRGGDEEGTVPSVAPGITETQTITPNNTPASTPSTQVAQVPSVIGQPLAHAQQTLESGGFRLDITGQQQNNAAAGTIIAQEPAAGSSMPPGSTVAVVVSSGPPAATDPQQNQEQAENTDQQQAPSNLETQRQQIEQAINSLEQEKKRIEELKKQVNKGQRKQLEKQEKALEEEKKRLEEMLKNLEKQQEREEDD